MSKAVPDKTRVLFVCSKNQWRSPTAEQIWRKHPQLSVRSGGTSQSARHTVNIEDIEWADVLIVMEDTHKTRLQASFGDALKHTRLYVLDIPDEYSYMNEALVAELSSSVAEILNLN